MLPTDHTTRKQRPLARGLLDYFPDACADVAYTSYIGNSQHNGDGPMRWAREKSQDHADCIVRHLIERGKMDTDGIRHSAKVAWRALAMLQLEIEAERDKNADSKPTVYIVGKMRGLDDFGYASFDAAAQVWADAGWYAVSPADLNRKRGVTLEHLQGMTDGEMLAFVKRATQEDMALLLQSDAVAVLPSWVDSTNGRIEVAVALAHEIPIHDARTMDRISDEQVREQLNGAGAAVTGE